MIHCALSIVHCTFYILHCTLYIVQCSFYIVYCTLYIVHCTLYNPVGYNRTRAVHVALFGLRSGKLSGAKEDVSLS